MDVALPLPLQTPFSYRVPERWAVPERGIRVTVPFGPRRVIGMVTGPSAAAQRRADAEGHPRRPRRGAAGRAAAARPRAWMADHYLAPPGECYRLALPPAGVRASRADRASPRRPDGRRRRPRRSRALARRPAAPSPPWRGASAAIPSARLARLRREGRVVDRPGPRRAAASARCASPSWSMAPRRRGRAAQAEVVERLRAAGGRAPVADLVRDRPSLRGALRPARAGRRRAHRGGARDARRRRCWRAAAARPWRLTADQAGARSTPIAAARRRAARTRRSSSTASPAAARPRCTSAPRSAALGRGPRRADPGARRSRSPRSSCARRSARFGRTVAVLHSELSAGERHDQWWRIREGEARVVIGARSAVFAPRGRPRPHRRGRGARGAPTSRTRARATTRRDVAVMRATLEGGAGGARLGHAVARVVRERAQGQVPPAGPARRASAPQGMPRVEVVDRRRGAARPAAIPILTPPLREALAARLERREQALLLLNRRGYATSLLCRECGQQASCPNCSVLPHPAPAAGAARCATTAAHEAPTPTRLRRLQGRVPAADRLRHREGGGGGAGGAAHGARRAPRPRPAPSRRGAVAAGAGRRSRRGRPTSWWARR